MELMAELEESRQVILEAVTGIQPFDEIEARQKSDVLDWIRSSAPLFRVAKPADPPQHLVSYFVLVDFEANCMLLVDHLKAGKWLPTGGHVEPNEDPRMTVVRELKEELAITASFAHCTGDRPLFLTSTETVGLTAGHTDISLWYVLKGSKEALFTYDKTEFAGVKWFGFEEILETDINRLDTHMHRFIRKLIENRAAFEGNINALNGRKGK